MSDPYIVCIETTDVLFFPSNEMSDLSVDLIAYVKPTWAERGVHGTCNGKHSELTPDEQDALRGLLRRIIVRLEAEAQVREDQDES